MFDILRPRHPVVTVLGRIRDQVAQVARDTAHIIEDLHRLRRDTMANFDGLTGSIDELKQTVAETAARIERRLDEVLDDTVDQAATDAAAAEIREATQALKAIAPDPLPTEPQPQTQPEA